MASSSSSSSTSSSKSPKSGVQSTVFLRGWWLDKAEKDSEGRILAVSGYARPDFCQSSKHIIPGRRSQPEQIFRSAPILKASNAFILETSNGMCIVLEGSIDKRRTEENGFPAEVYDERFVSTFPSYWEAYNKECIERESKEVKDLTDHVEATGEEVHEPNGRNNCAREVASKVIVRKKAIREVRSSVRLNSTHATRVSKEQTPDNSSTNCFKMGSTSAKSIKRKLKYETPGKEQEQETEAVSVPEPSRLKRSRSGRLLYPPMAFWRNERTIYSEEAPKKEKETIAVIPSSLKKSRSVTRSELSRMKRQLMRAKAGPLIDM